MESNHSDKINLINSATNPLLPVIPPLPHTSAILDSGCSNHYFPPDCPVTNLNNTNNGLIVTLPDSSTIQATHTATLPIPTLTNKATKVHVFPHLHSALISIGQLCDSECTVTFKKKLAYIHNATNELIAVGTRDPTSGMW